MKKHFDLFTIPPFNFGLIAYIGSIETQEIIKLVLTNAVMLLTLIYTAMKIYRMWKNKGSKNETD